MCMWVCNKLLEEEEPGLFHEPENLVYCDESCLWLLN